MFWNHICRGRNKAPIYEQLFQCRKVTIMDSSFFNLYTNQTSLQDLMKEVVEAIRLDDESQDKEAYIKYTSCIYKIASNLLHNTRVSHWNLVVTPNVSRQVKLLQQCVERVNSLVDKMEQDQTQKSDQSNVLSQMNPGIQQISMRRIPGLPKNSNSLNDDTIARAEAEHFARTLSPLHQTVRTVSDLSLDMGAGHKSLPIHIDVPALTAENNPHVYNKVRTLSPLEMAHAQNKSLIIAYKARMKRLNKSNFSAYNYSLTLQRKMAENLAIAKAQEEELAKKMKARQERLEEEASRRFACPNDMSLEEKEHQKLYKSILDYENDVEWLTKWRQKLAKNREDPVLICQIVQEILRCSDHPITELLRSLQFKIHEQLYPLVANKHANIDHIKVDLPPHLWPTLDDVSDILPAVIIRTSSSVPAPEVRRKKRIRSKSKSISSDSDKHGSEMSKSSSSDEDDKKRLDLDQNGAKIGPADVEVELKMVKDVNSDVDDVIPVTPGKVCDEDCDSSGVGDRDDGKKYVSTDFRNAMPSTSSSEMVGEGGGNKSGEKFTKEANIDDSDCSSARAIVKDVIDSIGDSSDLCSEKGSMSEDGKGGQETGTPMVKTDDAKLIDDNAAIKSDSSNTSNKSASFHDSSSDSEDSDIRQRMESVASTVSHTHIQLREACDKGRKLEAELTLQRQRARLLMQQISRDYDSFDPENFDDLFDDEDEEASGGDSIKSNDVPITQSRSEIGSVTSDDSRENELNRSALERSQSNQSAHRLSSHSEPEGIGFSSLPPNINQAPVLAISRLTMEAYERHLKGICNEIHLDLDKLLQVMIVAYEALDTPVGKDQCAVALEEPFFKPIWKTLLRLYRVMNYKKETVMACVMTSYKGARPETLKVRDRFCLNKGQDKPYQEVIDELLRLPQYYTIVCKLDCMVKVCRLICECVDKFYRSEESPKGKAKTTPVMGADDLVPVLTYVIVSTECPQLVSECQAMTEFIAEGYMMGEEGYCLTTFRTAMEYLISLFVPLKEE